MQTSEKILRTLKTVQIYPSKVRVEPNDKMSKLLFSQDYIEYLRLMEGKKAGAIEKKNHKKHGKVATIYKLNNTNGYNDINPLNEFHRAVLGVCISEMVIGNEYTTNSIIFRALVGKVGEVGIVPSVNQEQAIEDAIDKMMFTEFDSNVAQSLEKLEYGNGESIEIEKSAILPCARVKAIINGQVIKAIYFTLESPLFLNANLRKQLIRYDNDLLDVPNQNNTPLIISLKNYVIRRVAEIKLHKQMSPTITFEDVFKKCRIIDADAKKKFYARTTILQLFEHLKEKNFITSYNIEKRGVTIYGVKFSFKSNIQS